MKVDVPQPLHVPSSFGLIYDLSPRKIKKWMVRGNPVVQEVSAQLQSKVRAVRPGKNFPTLVQPSGEDFLR